MSDEMCKWAIGPENSGGRGCRNVGKDSIKNLDAKQRGKERAFGNQKMRQHKQTDAAARASGPKLLLFCQVVEKPLFQQKFSCVGKLSCLPRPDSFRLVLDLPEEFWG